MKSIISFFTEFRTCTRKEIIYAIVFSFALEYAIGL
jgi:hypothetical protein